MRSGRGGPLLPVLLALLLILCRTGAAASGDWVTLNDCTLVNSGYMDGDSFHARCGGKNYHFRLYFVDCPETDTRFPERILEQSAYFGIRGEQIPAAGMKAEQFTRKFLNRPFTVLTKWEDAKGASAQERFYAVVLSDGKNLAEELLAAGLARDYGMQAPYPDAARNADFVAALRQAEERARRAHIGAWSKNPATKPVPEPADRLAPLKNSTNPEVSPPPQSGARPPNPSDRQNAQSTNPVDAATSSPLLNINTASAAELEQLPGIGPALAGRIVANRPYAEPADITAVKGVGPKIFASIESFITTK